MTGPKLIFLIDDDPLYIFLTKEIISYTNIEADIKEFHDGQEVLDYLKENTQRNDLLPDLILLDLHMQIMDGWEFLDHYVGVKSAIEKIIPLYIVSSSISPHDLERSKSSAIIEDFIIKPLEEQKFVDIINKISHSPASDFRD